MKVPGTADQSPNIIGNGASVCLKGLTLANDCIKKLSTLGSPSANYNREPRSTEREWSIGMSSLVWLAHGHNNPPNKLGGHRGKPGFGIPQNVLFETHSY